MIPLNTIVSRERLTFKAKVQHFKLNELHMEVAYPSHPPPTQKTDRSRDINISWKT